MANDIVWIAFIGIGHCQVITIIIVATCSPVWLNSHSLISRSSLNLIVCQKCTLCILGKIITRYTVMQYNTLESLTVVLESTAVAPTFRGFLIQARLVADDSTVVGQFEAPPVGGVYRYGSCANTEVEKNIYSKIALLKKNVDAMYLYIID